MPHLPGKLKRTTRVFIVTGRFQPIHRGHVLFWKKIVHRFSCFLIVCVLRDERHSNEKAVEESENEYLVASKWTHAPKNNPMPAFNRLQLVALAIASDPVLRKAAIPMLRSRPDISWEASLRDLPTDRTWVFNLSKGHFDRTKPQFYRSKGERVQVVQMGKFDYEGTKIREQLSNGIRSFTFLPSGCETYFRCYCLSFFLEPAS